MHKFLNISVLSTMLLSLALTNMLVAQPHEEDQTHQGISTNPQEDDQNDSAGEASTDEEFNSTEVIMHHIQDAHSFHIYGEGEDAVSFPLPVILYTNAGLVTFMSSAFHHDSHGHHVVERNGMRFVNYHDDIYQLNEGAESLAFGEEHSVLNASLPLDFSITKNVFTLFLGSIIIFLIFTTVAAGYKKGPVPKGLASFMEPLVVFVRDEIAEPNIGPKHTRYLPYLLTLFFFIWVINLMGLVPFFPFSANLSGNISFTLTMAFIALLVVNFSGNKHYWKHIFAPKPWWLWPILFTIEFLSNVVIKFFALMIRLFANITAGHIIILSLISLIFIFKSVYMSAVSVPFALFISVLELLVAALQAFIFTLLTALFIGQAVAEKAH
jgi:F-type H+-transporting ATPase subunit a